MRKYKLRFIFGPLSVLIKNIIFTGNVVFQFRLEFLRRKPETGAPNAPFHRIHSKSQQNLTQPSFAQTDTCDQLAVQLLEYHQIQPTWFLVVKGKGTCRRPVKQKFPSQAPGNLQQYEVG